MVFIYILILYSLINIIRLNGENGDCLLILSGLKSYREQMPSTRIILKVNTVTPFVNNESNIEIIYDKGQYSFVETNKNDISKIIYNGTDILHLMSDTVYIRNIKQSTAYYFFDPRILGISSLLWGQTLNGCIPINKETTQVYLVGTEEIEGKIMRHVKVLYNDKYEYDYWIDVGDHYKVYKYQESLTNVYKRIVTSKYENDNKYIPSHCEIYSINSKSNILWRTIVDVIRYEHNIKKNNNYWTIAGLNPNKGTAVVDLRTHKTLGHWDGSKIITLKDKIQPQQQPKVPRMLLIGVMMVVFLAPLLVMLVRKFRKAM